MIILNELDNTNMDRHEEHKVYFLSHRFCILNNCKCKVIVVILRITSVLRVKVLLYDHVNLHFNTRIGQRSIASITVSWHEF